LYFSKLALMELGGWIEVTMDGIVRDCAKKHLSGAQNLKEVEDQTIRRTYGFDYNRQFRQMLITVLGLVKVEEMEGQFDSIKFALMKSSLSTLKYERDRAAHTYIAGVTTNLLAPSTISNHFQQVYDGLKDIERCVRRLKI
jgi:hypothetical protein